uniref:Formamidopyrimidine-DNA glycosylase catalytic domain-containing protein n=1 Tax=Chaetoceros debilis TaxID=122233 RepID=A0A7S3QDU6_9STRA
MPELVEVEKFRLLLLRLCSKEGVIVSKSSNKKQNHCPQNENEEESSSPSSILPSSLLSSSLLSSSPTGDFSPLSIECPSPTPPKNFPTEAEIKILQQYYVKDVERKGKLLRLIMMLTATTSNSGEADKSTCIDPLPPMKYVYFHMGMTGRISTPDYVPSLESLSGNDTFPPPHTHLIIKVGKVKVAFSDPRRFGAVSIDSNGPLDSQWNTFATDALDPDSSLALDGLIGHRKGVKALLLDQRAIVSGVGNWIADELCYQARIHPDQAYLTNDEVKLLKFHLDNILKIGIDAKENNFPKDWIFHRRWSKNSKTQMKDRDGNTVLFIQSGGRSSAIVPSLQKNQKRKRKKPESDNSNDDVKNMNTSATTNTKSIPKKEKALVKKRTRTSSEKQQNKNSKKEVPPLRIPTRRSKRLTK